MLNKYNLEITQFASKDESRYTLQAIRVTPTETVAANEHRLVIVTTPPGMKAESFPVLDGRFTATDEFEPFNLSLDAAKAVAKAIPRKSSIPILECVGVGKVEEREGDHAGRTAQLCVNNLENPQVFTPRIVEGMFPNYAYCVPPLACAEPVSFNAKYLAEIFAALAKFNAEGRNVTCEIRLQGPVKPMRIDAQRSDGQRMTCVLMPVKIDAPVTDAKLAEEKGAEDEGHSSE